MLTDRWPPFMNAFTASDYTMYPFSDAEFQRFPESSVGLFDAVFFPCLRELDFWQEGWRLENSDPQDPSSPLVFKGVVFNEMKGAFSDNERLYAQHLQQLLLPDHTYSHTSGGQPLAIPDLTWDQLRHFHQTHYHPSNARFFTYGDLPLEQHLKQIQDEALVRFQRTQPDTHVPKQQPWTTPREAHVSCSPDVMAPDPNKQHTLTVSYLLGDITDVFESFVLSLISSLMISGPNAPFYRTLIEPNIGSDFSSMVGYDGSTRQGCFTVGLQGIAEHDASRVKRIIHDTLDDIIAKGFEEERIEALLHKLEIQIKHQSSSFGLSLASYIASCWNHEGDPIELLRVGENVDLFRRKIAQNPNFLQEKVRHYFKENTHTLTLSMSPDEDYVKKQADSEEVKLRQKIQQLNEDNRKDIYQKGLQLLSEQTKVQDVSCLPALQISDIQPHLTYTHTHISTTAGVPIQYCEQPTNGMVYFRALLNINTLAEELKPYTPLFCSVITKMGCGGLDYKQQAQQMDLYTGGMSVTPQILPDHTHMDTYEQGILLSSSCLERNVSEMFHLWSDIFNSPHFEDSERLRSLVMMSAQELANGVADSGHVMAMTRAARSLSPASQLQETFGGMEQVKFMKRVAESSDLTSVLRKLARVKRHLLNAENMRCAINAAPPKMAAVALQTEGFVGSVAATRKQRKAVRPHITERPLDPSADPSSSLATRKLVSEPSFQACAMKTFYQLPFPVNFVSECVRTVPYTHPDYASLCVLARLMSSKFLHGEIREKGGAYGGGARIGGGGVYSFYSYRDPNSTGTLSAFRRGVDWARSGSFTQQDIDQSKLSVFSQVDAPLAPSEKGLSVFLWGLSDDMRQQHRERLFNVTHTHLVDTANRYLSVGKCVSAAAILGPQNEALSKDPSWICH
ncbi:hypothetical protein ACEWY4_027640 [Coilia grayii]|uniref:Pitrilysin metalloproteinase 1 n=1 Tax=Coilia grayii TaxID=363190 RepID=A0ABD1IP42_9TELE